MVRDRNLSKKTQFLEILAERPKGKDFWNGHGVRFEFESWFCYMFCPDSHNLPKLPFLVYKIE